MAPSLAERLRISRPALKVPSPAGKEPLASLDDNAGTGTGAMQVPASSPDRALLRART